MKIGSRQTPASVSLAPRAVAPQKKPGLDAFDARARPMVLRAERGEMKRYATKAEAQALFDEVASMTFESVMRERLPVPYKYQQDGCNYRAQLIAERIFARGFSVNKIFVSASPENIARGQGITLPSVYGDAMLGHTPARFDVMWTHHVAATILVWNQTKNRQEKMVIDPALADRPLSVKAWSDLFHGETAIEHANANAMFPADVHSPREWKRALAEEKLKDGIPTLTTHAARVATQELVAKINMKWQSSNASREDKTLYARGFLRACSPEVQADFKTRFRFMALSIQVFTDPNT